MLSVKGVYSGGSGGGGGANNTVWAESWYPDRGVTKPTDLLSEMVHLDYDISIYANVKKSTNTVIAEVLNTDTYVSPNLFYKAVQGSTQVTI